ncbi:MAG: FliA/WhiG family RNA polymerase sigma factor [Lachnospiraceae bacterium]|nr:FliA/WhiG family RNA polymerase sigma factor [Lachnospiraceae bacterium]
MKDTDRQKLWDNYRTKPTPELREKIIVEYAPLVKIVAGKMNMYLGNNVEYDDLVGYGVFGLIDAIDKFDTSKDVKFETYASLRIKGAILDQIRKMDWIPRTIRQKQRKIEEATRSVEERSGRVASDEEVAAELGLSDKEYLDWQSQMKITNLVSLNEFMEAGNEPAADMASTTAQFIQPEESVSKDELSKMLAESLELLTEKEKSVIVFYYYEDLTLKEISKVMEVSESRVSQLHTKALLKMRKKMGPYMNVLTEA